MAKRFIISLAALLFFILAAFFFRENIIDLLWPKAENPHRKYFIQGDEELAAQSGINLFVLSKSLQPQEISSPAENPLLIKRDARLFLTGNNNSKQNLYFSTWTRDFERGNLRYLPRPGEGGSIEVPPGVVNKPLGMPLIIRAINKNGPATFYAFVSEKRLMENEVLDWLEFCPAGGEFCAFSLPKGVAVFSRIVVFDLPDEEETTIVE
jgi:hypothetical protein